MTTDATGYSLAAWPNSNTDLTLDNDNFWLGYLPSKYVATVSPSFFTHFGYKVSLTVCG